MIFRKKQTVEDRIYTLVEMFRTTESEEARECYKQHASLMILERPLDEQPRLEDMVEWEIE